MIAIIDYGMGNIHSVNKALQSLGARVKVIRAPSQLKNQEKVVLPGVGAFDDAMRELERRGLSTAIKDHAGKKKIILGICLGMQLLFDLSEEAKKEKGLGVLKGSVVRFNEKTGIKIPHIGWNQINKLSAVSHQLSAKCPLLEGVPDGSYVYFCHSYYPVPKDKTNIAGRTNYGKDFTSVVWQENIFGVQFHPEKSQAVGLRMLKNFVNM